MWRGVLWAFLILVVAGWCTPSTALAVPCTDCENYSRNDDYYCNGYAYKWCEHVVYNQKEVCEASSWLHDGCTGTAAQADEWDYRVSTWDIESRDWSAGFVCLVNGKWEYRKSAEAGLECKATEGGTCNCYGKHETTHWGLQRCTY